MSENTLVLAREGRTSYVIVMVGAADPTVQRAATELQRFLEESTGAHFAIRSGEANPDAKEVVVCVEAAKSRVGFPSEGFTITGSGDSIVITGASPRGALYGVYTLLEDFVGFRWYSERVTRVPKHDELVIDVPDIAKNPTLEYREPFFTEAFDGDWAARNFTNGFATNLDAIHGGKVKYGHFVHTFNVLLPPEKHFEQHPEWYSEIDGKRTADHTELCLTNPEVLEKVIEGVRGWIRDNPDATIFSVSQNDWENQCTCAKCRELDEREGSPQGTILTFVNAVAEAIEDESPHIAIDTLAYWYSRKAPKTIIPRPNVIIRLCTIECCFAHPLDTCAENASFVDDIREWNKITDRLYIWDYVTNFHNYMMPWPNFNVLASNIRFFVSNGVKGLFEQGAYAAGGGGEMGAMRSYVMARLMWDQNADEKALRDEFIDGVYGDAADLVRRYHDLIHEPVADPDVHMKIFCDVDNPHITDEIISKGDELLTQAEEKAESREVKERVEVAHLPVQYVRIRRMDPADPDRQKLLDHFLSICEREGFISISEGATIENWVNKAAAGDPNDARA
jgi:hypothetical protein